MRSWLPDLTVMALADIPAGANSRALFRNPVGAAGPCSLQSRKLFYAEVLTAVLFAHFRSRSIHLPKDVVGHVQ